MLHHLVPTNVQRSFCEAEKALLIFPSGPPTHPVAHRNPEEHRERHKFRNYLSIQKNYVPSSKRAKGAGARVKSQGPSENAHSATIFRGGRIVIELDPSLRRSCCPRPLSHFPFSTY